MKKALIAFALSACSAPALADRVPPFVLHCSIAKTPPVPMTVKWDGRTLKMETKGTGSRLSVESLDADMRASQPPLNYVALSFNGLSQQRHTYVSINLTADANGKLRAGSYNLAFLFENRLSGVADGSLADCTSTLDR
ncbi:hypothetical protein [Achromobacter sp. ACRQX]|uniref:hypothetical protein n=1 Tax=Achromobacter sp. ACRQX TaxID=2918181 RepID=UPI001EF294D6|nr:hypothetical protein [Achromobacter sp. ACRQX]MCG7326841.1 hypothetical protein [Achromobacter sp. ACRQX]